MTTATTTIIAIAITTTTNLFETFEVDNKNIGRRPQRQPLDHFLLPIARRAMPRIFRPQLLRLRVQLKDARQTLTKPNKNINIYTYTYI